MRRIGRRKNERGLTLLEALVALMILTMVTSIIYSFVLMAMSIYKRVTIETTMRNQGDLLFSRIVTELGDAIYVEQADSAQRSIRFVKPSADPKQYIAWYEMRIDSGQIRVEPIMPSGPPKVFALAPAFEISSGKLIAEGHHHVVIDLEYRPVGVTSPVLNIRSRIPVGRGE